MQREVTQKNNLLTEKDTLIGEKDHRLAELSAQLVRQQEVRLPVIDPPPVYVYESNYLICVSEIEMRNLIPGVPSRPHC